ncbi:hypothetical protein [Nocardioides sp. SYSU D00065]|uniref:hypothetical protein n=1 Tax=Nocardioides sp. SYSU D00065 TaxID=2817378 RepID=UPI001B31B323|nr:hypothetical protein [Nocardioides sp. SYSU D00065]
MRLEHRYDRLWERLLALLDTLGQVDAGTPGRLRLQVEKHDIEIMMSERDWSELVGIPHGSFVSAAAELLLSIKRAQMDGHSFLVYDDYTLHPSRTTVSPVRFEAEDQPRQHPGVQGEWRAYPPGTEPT